jgi:two-component system response regulator YesN
MRVEKAKELLKDSNLSIATIAIEVGYNDQSYFSKVFKYWEGISPARYRKKVL